VTVKKRISLLRRAVKLLGEAKDIKDVYAAMDLSHEAGYRPADLYAAVLAMLVNEHEAALSYIKGPSSSTRWGGTGYGCIRDLKREIIKLKKKLKLSSDEDEPVRKKKKKKKMTPESTSKTRKRKKKKRA
jgi:hypothetical protein